MGAALCSPPDSELTLFIAARRDTEPRTNLLMQLGGIIAGSCKSLGWPEPHQYEEDATGCQSDSSPHLEKCFHLHGFMLYSRQCEFFPIRGAVDCERFIIAGFISFLTHAAPGNVSSLECDAPQQVGWQVASRMLA